MTGIRMLLYDGLLLACLSIVLWNTFQSIRLRREIRTLLDEAQRKHTLASQYLDNARAVLKLVEPNQPELHQGRAH